MQQRKRTHAQICLRRDKSRAMRCNISMISALAGVALAIAANTIIAAAFQPSALIRSRANNVISERALLASQQESIQERQADTSAGLSSSDQSNDLSVHNTPMLTSSINGHTSSSGAASANNSVISSISDTSKSAKCHVLSIDEINPIIKFDKKGKLKVINATGFYHLFIMILTVPIWYLAMDTLRALGNTIEGFDVNRAKFDYSGKIWCRTYLAATGCYPVIEGNLQLLRQLKEAEKNGTGDGGCLFVANHASFLDIPLLCCVLDPVFKFIAKDSLKTLPGVGKQLLGGDHVLIDRTTKRSQLRTFKQAINYLKDGVPIMAFPEGARSPDGRLMPFKGGIFSMAVKAKVPIVPLSLANAHAVLPGCAVFPVQDGKGKLRVHVHDAISVEGKSEEEIAEEVKRALLSKLPLDQHPLDEVDS